MLQPMAGCNTLLLQLCGSQSLTIPLQGPRALMGIVADAKKEVQRAKRRGGSLHETLNSQLHRLHPEATAQVSWTPGLSQRRQNLEEVLPPPPPRPL